MLGPQPDARWRRRPAAWRSVWTAPGQDRAQRDADGQHVDDLLQDRARCGRQQPDGGGDHRDERQAHADQDGLQRDALGAARDEDGVGQRVDPVDGEHDVGRLGGRRRAAGGQRHARRRPRRAPGRR